MPTTTLRSPWSIGLALALGAASAGGSPPHAAAVGAPLTGAVADAGRWSRSASVQGAAIVARSGHVRVVDAPARAGRVMVVTRVSSPTRVRVDLRVRLLRQRLAAGRGRALVRLAGRGGSWVEAGVVRAPGGLRWGLWTSRADGRRVGQRLGGAVRLGVWTRIRLDSRAGGSSWTTTLTVGGRGAARLRHGRLAAVPRAVGVGLGTPPTTQSGGAVDIAAPPAVAPGGTTSPAAPRPTAPRTTPRVPTTPTRTTPPPAPVAPPPAPWSGRWYSASSPWNTRIPANPALHPASAAAVRTLVEFRQSRGLHLALREWTVPVYYADARTPRHTVAITAPWTSFRSFSPVPIPDGAAPDPQGDGHLMIVDTSTGCEYDLWQARRTASGGWSASWGNSTTITGTGSFPGGLAARGSGLALGAGLVRPEELAAGRIDHALFVVYQHTKADVFVAPATKTDGRSTRADALPMGARIQLDPSLDLNTLRLTPHERVIARAMQEYGMIVGDTGGGFGLFAVHAASAGPGAYPGLPTTAVAPLANIPVERFRVISTGPELTNRQSLTTACGALR